MTTIMAADVGLRPGRFDFVLASAGIQRIEDMAAPGKKDGGGQDVLDRPPSRDLKTTFKPKVEKPKMFRVVLHNDHSTPHSFVVQVLMQIFNKNAGEANMIMRAAESNGAAQVGVYTFEIAETRIDRAAAEAHKKGHMALTFSMEPE